MAKFIGRWVDRENVVHADDPYRRKGLVVGRFDHGADTKNPFTGRTPMQDTLARHPCGRSSMAIHRYLPRSTIPTCLTCLVAVMLETPSVSSTRSTSRRRRSRRRRA